MSILDIKPHTGERMDMKTIDEFKAEERSRLNAYQKESRKTHLVTYQKQKKIIDKLKGKRLVKYLAESKDIALDTRVGNFNMKVNAYEFALIKLALDKTGARSSRELFIDLIKNAGLIDDINKTPNDTE